VIAGSDITRAGLASLIQSSEALSLVATASSVSEALASEVEADVFLVDSDDPRGVDDLDGRAVLVLADRPESFRTVALGYLPRSASAAQILAALESVAAGLVVYDPIATPVGAVPVSHPPSTQLTTREMEVLGMLAEGLANKEIAWRLQITEHTVKFHISSIFQKLGVSSRTEAVAKGMRMGLVLL
jgi:DNA-binding NarL/FixJ family response regulator